MTVSAGRGGVLAGQKQKAGQRPLPTTFEEVYANIDRVKGGTSGSNNQIYSGTELQAIAKSLGLKVVPGKKAQAKVITDAGPAATVVPTNHLFSSTIFCDLISSNSSGNNNNNYLLNRYLSFTSLLPTDHFY